MPAKQRNKAHKHGKHKSKGAKKESSKGRVGKVAGTPTRKALKLERGGNAAGSRQQRHQLMQARLRQSREATVQARRIGRKGAPKIVGFLPASGRTDQAAALRAVAAACGAPASSGDGARHVDCARHRQVFTLLSAPDDYQLQLDVAKVADILVLVLRVHSDEDNATGAEIEPDLPDDQSVTTAGTWYSDIGLCIDEEGRQLLRTLSCQGMPSVCVVLEGLQTIPSAKQRKRIAKVHLRYFQSIFSAEQVPKVFTADTPETCERMVRHLCESQLRHVHWRDARPYFLVDDCRWHDDAAPVLGADGAPARPLRVSGFLRGKPMSANQLVHLTGYGTYQVDAIHASSPGAPPGELLSAPDGAQESLQYCQVPDPMDGEQTWPTEEEMAAAERAERERQERLQGGRMRKLKVPEGYSDYQAAWVTDQADLESDDSAELRGADAASAAPSRAPSRMTGVSRATSAAQTDVEDALGGEWLARDEAMTVEERAEQVAKLQEESKEDRDFPDEVETPLHISARVRFQKYRGLESYRRSEWDPNENLPLDYARIFKFQNFRRTQRNAIAAAGDAPVPAASYVTVVLRAVPARFIDVWDGRGGKASPLIASGLLRHEQKYSVMHLTLQRNKEYDEALKSKQRLVCHFGFRKVVCNPLFAESAKGDRTKFLRYFHKEHKFVMASVFAPTMYQPTPVLCFLPITRREKADGVDMPLVAHGSTEHPNPDMLLLKKVMLTGHIYKTHKRQSIVRFMFHNEDDVKWFQPVELYTKLGFRGKIMKSVGTHGHMKAQFSGIVQGHDVVCMDLWKRVFPKWTTAAFSWLAETPQDEASDGEEGEEEENEEEEEGVEGGDAVMR